MLPAAVSVDSNKEVALLKVKEAWISYLNPSIRVADGRIGETTATKVLAYFEDKIQIEARVRISPNDEKSSDGTITITIDRNTGSAEFQLSSLWNRTSTGMPFRYEFQKWSGICARQQPKF